MLDIHELLGKKLKINLDFLTCKDVINGIQKLDETKEISFTYMMIDFFEIVFVLRENEMISEEIWKSYKNSIIRCFSQSPTFRRIWESKVSSYQMYYKPLRDFINGNIESSRYRF